jgi:hypothetical protein
MLMGQRTRFYGLPSRPHDFNERRGDKKSVTIMCDWHFEKRPQGYPSVVYLQEKGFRMLPSTWRSQEAALATLREARTKATPKLLGHLCTTWVGAQGVCRALLAEPPPEETKPKADAKAKRQRGPDDIVAALKTCMEELTRVEAPTK